MSIFRGDTLEVNVTEAAKPREKQFIWVERVINLGIVKIPTGLFKKVPTVNERMDAAIEEKRRND